MNLHTIILAAGGIVSLSGINVHAHTECEYLDMGRNMVGTVLATDFHDEEDLLAAQESDDPVFHWDYTSQSEFFNFFVTNNWSLSDCQTAFNRYLSWISTNDMSVFSSQEKRFARGAVGQCICMNYTSALSTIRAYAANPTAEDRLMAIDAAVRLGGVDSPSLDFIETFLTNKTDFAYDDIRFALWSFCDKLEMINTNDISEVAIRDRSARLFYENRYDWKCATTLDRLFASSFPGYAYSTNRLEYANFVLSWTTNSEWRAMHNHFISVTNEMLSSGHPLVELSMPSPE